MIGNIIEKEGHGRVTVTPSLLMMIESNPKEYSPVRLTEKELRVLGFDTINPTSSVMWGYDIHLHLHENVWVYEESEFPIKFMFVHQLQNYLTLTKELYDQI